MPVLCHLRTSAGTVSRLNFIGLGRLGPPEIRRSDRNEIRSGFRGSANRTGDLPPVVGVLEFLA